MRLGSTAQKILLLLLGGVALGLSGTPKRYARVWKATRKALKEVDKQKLYRAIRRLYESKLIQSIEHEDGSITLILTRTGKKVALRYKIDDLVIAKPVKWDNKWRVIIFDIPEDQKPLRDTLRMRLKQLGLIELQKSVFVHPYECRDEIDFVIELYQARSYVRIIEAIYIDNELHLKKKFSLL